MKHVSNILIILIISATAFAATVKGDWGNIPSGQIKGIYDQATMPLELSPERGRFILTKSLAENQSFSLSQELADAAYPDVGVFHDRYYVYFAPGISLYALPFYMWGQAYNLAQIASFSSIALFALSNVLFIYIICTHMLKLKPHAAVAAALTFSVGSFALSYATTLYQHHATTFFILSGFYGVWQFSQKRWYGYLWGLWTWIAFGLSIWIDYPNAILLAPVMIYFAACAIKMTTIPNGVQIKLRWSAALLGIAGAALIAAHGYYNYIQFESPTRLSGHLVGYKTVLEENIDRNAADSDIGKLQAEKESASFFKEELMPNGLHTLLTAPDKGIFIFAPIFIIGFITMIIVLTRPTTEYVMLSSIVFTHITLYSSWADPWGGWAYGPRYMIPVAAILSIFIARALSIQNAWKYAIRILAIVLFSVSAVITWIGALTTNAVPPASEAAALNTSYGVQYAWNFLVDNRSGSFAFNHFVKNYMHLNDYFRILAAGSVVVFTTTLTVPTILEAIRAAHSFYVKRIKGNVRSTLVLITRRAVNMFGRKVL